MTLRDFEPGIVTDLTDRLTYAGYLRLDRLLTAQAPLPGTATVPSLYDAFLRHPGRRGLPVPAACRERDCTGQVLPGLADEELARAAATIAQVRAG